MLGSVPVNVILSWPAANHIDPPTRGWTVVILCIIFGLLAVVTSVARFWARGVVMQRFFLDDYMMIGALTTTIAMLVCECVGTRVFNIDRHIWDVDTSLTRSTERVTWSMEFLYVVSSGLTKLSVLVFYLRLADRRVSPKFIYATWLAIVLVIGYIITFMFVAIFACTPFHALWDSYNPSWVQTHDYHCINQGLAIGIQSLISLVHDLLTALLPATLLYGTRIPVKQKLGIAMLFSLGISVCGIVAGRIIYQWAVVGASWDETWDGYTIWCFTATELPLMVVCANTPALKVLFCGDKDVVATNAGAAVSCMRLGEALEEQAVHRPSDWSGQTLGQKSDGGPLKPGSEEMTHHQMTYNLVITSPLAVYGQPKKRRIDSVAAALEDGTDMC